MFIFCSVLHRLAESHPNKGYTLVQVLVGVLPTKLLTASWHNAPRCRLHISCNVSLPATQHYPHAFFHVAPARLVRPLLCFQTRFNYCLVRGLAQQKLTSPPGCVAALKFPPWQPGHSVSFTQLMLAFINESNLRWVSLSSFFVLGLVQFEQFEPCAILNFSLGITLLELWMLTKPVTMIYKCWSHLSPWLYEDWPYLYPQLYEDWSYL